MHIEDTEACYRAVKSRDRRFDGVLYVGVASTGIYCRPSCPATMPAKRNVTFHRTAAAAQAAGFRACKRCRPDATPGSPDWDVSADVAGRAMRLIGDGLVEREGVEGLASRVGYTTRHLHRLLTAELGAGPLALARARRAQNARILVETTSMPFADVAFAAGFSSVRQFNDTVRAVYAATPSALRAAAPRGGASPRATAGHLELRLPVRAPYAAAEWLRFLAAHLVPGVESSGPDWYERTLRLPHGAGQVRLNLPVHEAPEAIASLRCRLTVEDLRDVGPAVERCRRLLDADCDPLAVEDELAADPFLAVLVRSRPGLRVPGSVDGDELAVRAVLGQQISLAGAISLAGKLVTRYGHVLPGARDDDRPGLLFPGTDTLAAVDPAELPMPRARARALVALCEALATGCIRLDRSADRGDVRQSLLAVPGIGPWTADYIAMRALGDPDVFLPTDVGVRRALLGRGADPSAAEAMSRRWRPWRSYGLLHLWSTLDLGGRNGPAAP
ncbi:MAG TPA: AlkA N-terminal domain-containing protein [Nocardioidaceae bacterium]|nr:AlkA N-terminal domain-containing protein [Nocardioidaceae bacterium]